MKKILSILLALTLVLSLSVAAFAANGNSITVNNAQNGETYAAYKMFDLTVDLNKGETGAYSYTVAEAWEDFFTTGGGAQYIVKNDAGYVTDVTSPAALAQAAAAVAANMTGKSVTAANGKAVIDGLENGYYLITSTNGTIAMIDSTPTSPAQQIDEKNDNPSVEKTVKEDSTNNFGKVNDAQIGDTVDFKTVISVKKGAKGYVLHDVMTAGLTLNADSITVAGLTKGTDYTVVTTGLTDGCTFEVVFNQSYLNTITANTTLTVNYSAVLNENASYTAGQLNKTHLTWGDKSSTVEDSTTTSTYKFEVLKYDAADTSETPAPLAGATFELHKGTGESAVTVNLIKVDATHYRVANGNESGAVTTFTTVASGNIVIDGVDNDSDYTLVETEAPAGYNLLKDPVSVTVGTQNSFVAVIANQSGSELPATGGIGTTIFYVLGATMLAAAAVLLITKKRMNVEG